MGNYPAYYSRLNDSQREVVDALDGPVLVLAGPGTGKTQLLSVRAAAILAKGEVRPENILILTYTNAAVKEMKERLARVIGMEGYDVEVATFHSFANGIIQESEDAANYVGDKVQMTEIEQVKVIEYILDHIPGLDDIRPFRAPYTYLKEIGRRIGELKRDGIIPDDIVRYLETHTEPTLNFEDKHRRRLAALAVVYRAYEELKTGSQSEIFDERGRYDFDDMILFATNALSKESSLREEYRKRFRYIMVDEYQDTNGAQIKLLFALAVEASPNLCCVGDDDQSIYRFQGASVGNFRILEERFPGIRTFSLKENYRSDGELIALSSNIIRLIPSRERRAQKKLESVKVYPDASIEMLEFTSEQEELLYIVNKIRSLKEKCASSPDSPDEARLHPYNNIAILVRKRSDILRVVDALLQAGIPYATDGKEDIGGEVRTRQLLDVLELANADPEHQSLKDLYLYKVLTADYMEIPLQDIFAFIAYTQSKRVTPHASKTTLLTEFLAYFYDSKSDIPFKAPESMVRASSLIERLLRDAPSRSVHGLLLDFVKASGLYAYILREYQNEKLLRIRDLRAITSLVNMIKSADLARPALRLDEFMEELKTRKDHELPLQGSLVTMSQDGVRVFTAHGSKGQEFHSVFIPFCLQNKNWPARARAKLIPLPSELFQARDHAAEKDAERNLFSHDEIRLFYVAITRAKSNLIFTASPTDNLVPSSYLATLGIYSRDGSAMAEDEVLTRYLSKSDKTDPLIGSEAVLSDMIANLALNPTRVNSYLSCNRKFLYNDLLKLPGPKKMSLVFGNCVHKALEETYRYLMDKKSFPDFEVFMESFLKELTYQGVDLAMRRQCTDEGQLSKLRNWFLQAALVPVTPIGLEKKLIITIGTNIIFTGKYDKMEPLDDSAGTVKIIDYKTGKPDDHIRSIGTTQNILSEECDGYLRQLVAYRLLFEKDRYESKGRKAIYGELVFIEPVNADLSKFGYKKGAYAKVAVKITDLMLTDMETLIKDVWRQIKDLRFDKLSERDEKKCRACDFDSICWG